MTPKPNISERRKKKPLGAFLFSHGKIVQNESSMQTSVALQRLKQHSA